jgi:hypothetical protein
LRAFKTAVTESLRGADAAATVSGTGAGSVSWNATLNILPSWELAPFGQVFGSLSCGSETEPSDAHRQRRKPHDTPTWCDRATGIQCHHGGQPVRRLCGGLFRPERRGRDAFGGCALGQARCPLGYGIQGHRREEPPGWPRPRTRPGPSVGQAAARDGSRHRHPACRRTRDVAFAGTWAVGSTLATVAGAAVHRSGRQAKHTGSGKWVARSSCRGIIAAGRPAGRCTRRVRHAITADQQRGRSVRAARRSA